MYTCTLLPASSLFLSLSHARTHARCVTYAEYIHIYSYFFFIHICSFFIIHMYRSFFFIENVFHHTTLL